jgi:hypothetical protein
MNDKLVDVGGGMKMHQSVIDKINCEFDKRFWNEKF